MDLKAIVAAIAAGAAAAVATRIGFGKEMSMIAAAIVFATVLNLIQKPEK